MIYMFLSNNLSLGDINLLNLSCWKSHVVAHMCYFKNLLGNVACFLLSADYFQGQLFEKNLSGIP